MFLRKLRGVVDPERKRKIIGRAFVEVFQKATKKAVKKTVTTATKKAAKKAAKSPGSDTFDPSAP